MEVTSKAVKAAERRLQVAEYYLKGARQSEIAEWLKVGQATISRDLKAIQAEWLKASLVDFNEAVAKELAKIDNLELAYWGAWDETMDLRSLQGIQWCIDRRCKLFGLDAPERVQINWRETLPEGVSPDDVSRQFNELLKLAAQSDAGDS
jgi:hypothetical protein